MIYMYIAMYMFWPKMCWHCFLHLFSTGPKRNPIESLSPCLINSEPCSTDSNGEYSLKIIDICGSLMWFASFTSFTKLTEQLEHIGAPTSGFPVCKTLAELLGPASIFFTVPKLPQRDSGIACQVGSMVAWQQETLFSTTIGSSSHFYLRNHGNSSDSDRLICIDSFWLHL